MLSLYSAHIAGMWNRHGLPPTRRKRFRTRRPRRNSASVTESERIDSSNPLKIQGSSLPNIFGVELRWKTRQEPNQWIQWQSFKFIIVCSFGKLFVRASAKARPYRIVVVPGEPSALDADATGKEALDGDRPPQVP